jgi:hypothetical protein
MYTNFIEPLEKRKGTPTYLEGQFLARGDEFPSTLIPCLVTTAPLLTLAPFHPFTHPTAHIPLATRTTSIIMVFFVRDTLMYSPIRILDFVSSNQSHKDAGFCFIKYNYISTISRTPCDLNFFSIL